MAYLCMAKNLVKSIQYEHVKKTPNIPLPNSDLIEFLRSRGFKTEKNNKNIVVEVMDNLDQFSHEDVAKILDKYQVTSMRDIINDQLYPVEKILAVVCIYGPITRSEVVARITHSPWVTKLRHDTVSPLLQMFMDDGRIIKNGEFYKRTNKCTNGSKTLKGCRY